MNDLSERELEFCKRSFNAQDPGGSGSVPVENLGAVLAGICLRIPDSDVQTISALADENNDGLISWDEFMRVGIQEVPREEFLKARCRIAYQQRGPEDPEYITLEELVAVTTEAGIPVSEAEVGGLYEGLARDERGRVGMEDLLAQLLLSLNK